MTALTPLSRFDDLFSEFRRLLPSMAQGSEIMGMGDIRLDVEEKDPKDKARVLMRETYRGSVSRSFTLPSEIDEAGVAAKLEDGVLKLTLPKREGARRRRIAIE